MQYYFVHVIKFMHQLLYIEFHLMKPVCIKFEHINVTTLCIHICSKTNQLLGIITSHCPIIFSTSCTVSLTGLATDHIDNPEIMAIIDKQLAVIRIYTKECLAVCVLHGIFCCLTGTLVDRIGRRLSVIINAVIFTIGSVILASSINLYMMV